MLMTFHLIGRQLCCVGSERREGLLLGFLPHLVCQNLILIMQQGEKQAQQVLEGCCNLRDDQGVVLCLFSKGVGIKDSNEEGLLATALRIFSRSFQGCLIVESNSFNAITWVGQDICKPRKLHFRFNEIKVSVSHRYKKKKCWFLIFILCFAM